MACAYVEVAFVDGSSAKKENKERALLNQKEVRGISFQIGHFHFPSTSRSPATSSDPRIRRFLLSCSCTKGSFIRFRAPERRDLRKYEWKRQQLFGCEHDGSAADQVSVPCLRGRCTISILSGIGGYLQLAGYLHSNDASRSASGQPNLFYTFSLFPRYFSYMGDGGEGGGAMRSYYLPPQARNMLFF